MNRSISRGDAIDHISGAILGIRAGVPTRVAIDGLSASGKTKLADDIASVLRRMGLDVLRVSLDNFKRPWSESHLYDRVTGPGYYRNAYDYDLIKAEVLEPLEQHGSRQVLTASIDPLTGQRYRDAYQNVDDDIILIADGVFMLRPELRCCWDFSVFLTLDFDLVLRRGADRDQAWEQDWETAAELYRSRYIPSEQLYLSEADPIEIADLVLDMGDPLMPIVLKS